MSPWCSRKPSPAAVPLPRRPPHTVCFYDTDEQLLTRLEEYVVQGVRAGAQCVVIATPEHRLALRERLAAHGQGASFTGLDARQTLSRFLVCGLPDAPLFELTVGGLARSLAAEGEVRAFGEMVALLLADGNLTAAVQLEELWNRLQRSVALSLLCGYPKAVALGAETRIAGMHTHVDPLVA